MSCERQSNSGQADVVVALASLAGLINGLYLAWLAFLCELLKLSKAAHKQISASLLREASGARVAVVKRGNTAVFAMSGSATVLAASGDASCANNRAKLSKVSHCGPIDRSHASITDHSSPTCQLARGAKISCCGLRNYQLQSVRL